MTSILPLSAIKMFAHQSGKAMAVFVLGYAALKQRLPSKKFKTHKQVIAINYFLQKL